MSNLKKYARSYAKAAFNIALKDGSLQAWSKALETLATCVESKNLKQLLLSPYCVETTVAEALIQKINSKDKHLVSFIQLLGQYKKLQALPALRDLFIEHQRAYEQKIEVTLTLANENPQEEFLKTIQSRIEKKSGRQVELNVIVDPPLLGGARIQMGDEVCDLSLRANLEKLRIQLMSA